MKRKTKKTKTENNLAKLETELTDELSEQQEQSNLGSIKTLESNVDTSFFYTNDKFINSFDNDEILAKIKSKYSNLNDKNTDSIIKKNLVYFLDDERFVDHILNYYNITILDLFKLLYKQYSSIFKGPYLKKIRKTIADKKYAKLERRKTDI